MLVGIDDKGALYEEIRRLRTEVALGAALTRHEWFSTLLLAQLMVGHPLGAPTDWSIVTGQRLHEAWDDLASIERVLRCTYFEERVRTVLFSGLHEGRRTRVWTFSTSRR